MNRSLEFHNLYTVDKFRETERNRNNVFAAATTLLTYKESRKIEDTNTVYNPTIILYQRGHKKVTFM